MKKSPNNDELVNFGGTYCCSQHATTSFSGSLDESMSTLAILSKRRASRTCYTFLASIILRSIFFRWT